jgi:hypothetical protein
MNTHKFALLVLVVCPAVLLSGCATVLREEDRYARRHSPANPPNLRLFCSESAGDVLVAYDEQCEGISNVQRRAYWLEPNVMNVLAGCQPRFVTLTNVQGLVPVPLTDNPANPPATSDRVLYAVLSTNAQSFSLCQGGKERADYQLPVYYALSRQRTKRVFVPLSADPQDAAILGGAFTAFGLGFAIAEAFLDHSGSPPPRPGR